LFSSCPQQKNASKKAWKGVQKTYKEVRLMALKKQSKKPEILSPEYLDRLSATPEYEEVAERLFESFLEYLVQAKLIG
jgi:hypothetical protein